MADQQPTTGSERDPSTNRLERLSSVPGDLPDSPQDLAKLEPEETTIDLPDVKDIPGQEFVHVPRVGEMADTTISSADEEGARVFERDDTRDPVAGTEFDVQPDEREALRDTEYMPTRDEDNLRQARMDSADFDGEPLNDPSFGVGQSLSGAELDIPDESDDTETEPTGQDDEENNYYSLDDTDRDQASENRTGA